MIVAVEKNNPVQIGRTLVTDSLGRRFIVSTISNQADIFPRDDFTTAVFEAHPEEDYPLTFADLVPQRRVADEAEARRIHDRLCEDLETFCVPIYTAVLVNA